MSNPIIQVTNLSTCPDFFGKSYSISHEGRERYTALPKESGQVRDVMAQKAKKISAPSHAGIKPCNFYKPLIRIFY